MTTAILIASVVAAAAATAALARSWWRDRPRLRLRFRGFTSSEDAITLHARVENYGSADVNQMDAYTVVPGITLGSEPTIGRWQVLAGAWLDLTVDLPRPKWADLPETADFLPKLNVRDVGVLLIYGGRRETYWLSEHGWSLQPTTLGDRVRRWRSRVATAARSGLRRSSRTGASP
ncbi:MAG: hypothetical protein ACJ79H_21565 [Myxococcales bacterium]